MLVLVYFEEKQNKLSLPEEVIDESSTIVSLSPYSNYLLDCAGVNYLDLYELVDEVKYRTRVTSAYNSLELLLEKYSNFSFAFYELSFLITRAEFYDVFSRAIAGKELIIISDADVDSFNDKYPVDKAKKVVKYSRVDNLDRFFYFKYHSICRISQLCGDLFTKLMSLLKFGKGIKDYKYDNRYYYSVFRNVSFEKTPQNITLEELDCFLSDLSKFIARYNDHEKTKVLFERLLERIHTAFKSVSEIKFKPFTFLSSAKDYENVFSLKRQGLPIFITQHGGYLHPSVSLKYSEILPADVNFVFNEFTKDLFENQKARNVNVIHSRLFNKKVRDSSGKYDFLYITFCSSYHSGIGSVSSSETSVPNNYRDIYYRHSEVIQLFGNVFKDKKLCIKLHPQIILGKQYVPLLELASKYDNVDIKFSGNVDELVNASDIIISDYFSSNFINRNIHLKRNIILFTGRYLSIPREHFYDLQKIFLIVNNITEFESAIRNTPKTVIDKNLDIINYYSSSPSEGIDVENNKIKLALLSYVNNK